jgi:predicted nucleic acid-binding protein
MDHETIVQALTLPFRDFEDAVQMAAAMQAGVDYLATRDVQDFQPAPLSVISPAELLTLL